MFTVFLKVAVIFFMVAIGFFANRKDILPIESNQYLVNLLLGITTPCMIVDSMASSELTEETMTSTIQVLVGSVIFFVVMPFIAYLLVKMLRYSPARDQGVLMVTITAVNNGFMGFPVTKSIFGDKYLLLMVISNIALTVYLYFIAIIQLNYGHKKRSSIIETLKPLCNMCMLAAVVGMIIFFGHITLPLPMIDFFGTIGDATVPISMIVVGIQLGNSNLREMFKNKKLILVSLHKVILVPFLTFLAVNWLPLTNETKLTMIFAAALPCAVVSVALASRESKNASLMAEGVALTTLFSMVTLPLAAIILMAMYIS